MSAIFTDWLPIQENPIRPGHYELTADPLWPFPPKIPLVRYWDGKAWHLASPDNDKYALVGWASHWRGIRKWVLVRRDDAFMTALAGQPVDVYVKSISKSGQTTHLGGLDEALGFDSEAAAIKYRDRNRRYSHSEEFVAVLAE